MTFSPLRASRADRLRARRRSQSLLETSETASGLPRSRRASWGLTRLSLLPALSCGLLGLGLAPGHALDAPSTPATIEAAASTASAPTVTPAANPPPASAATGGTVRFARPTRLRFRRRQAQPAPVGAAAQPAPAPAGPKPGEVTISGLVEWYYGVNVRAPAPPLALVTPSGETIKIDNAGRAFDINDREPSFSLGEVNITRAPGRGFPLGVTATLTVGDTARLVHATEPGGTSSWQTLQQLYLTYTPHIAGRDVAIDFGKFVTPFGAEVIEGPSNDNFSRGLLFLYAIPFYHAGLRASLPLSNTVTLAGGIVNGWNNVADDNNGKSEFVQFTWKPNAKYTGSLTFMGGPEGTGAYGIAVPKDSGNIETDLFEFLSVYQWNDKFKLALDLNYATAAGDFNGTHVSGNWFGAAAYARYQFTPKVALAGRIEQFEDMPGVGGAGLRLGGPYQKLRELTLTLEYAALSGRLISRLEYRHDHADSLFYGNGSGQGTTTDQDTFYFSQAYKF